MKKQVLMSALALALATTAATTLADPTEVVYTGQKHAKAICRAVIEDDPAEIQRQIRRANKPFSARRLGPATATSFTCNGQSLESFAVTEGSRKALAYLEGAPVEEAVASSK